MTLSRRGFFAALATAAAGMVLDPERALWTPGEKTHILPPPGGWGVLKPGTIVPIAPHMVGFDPAAASPDQSAWVLFEYDRLGVLGRVIEPPEKYEHFYLSKEMLTEDERAMRQFSQQQIAEAAKRLADEIDKGLLHVYAEAYEKAHAQPPLTYEKVKEMWKGCDCEW